MAIPSRTLLQLCQAVADALDARESGTATGGSTTTLVCASHPFMSSLTGASTNTYKLCEIRPTDGDEEGEARDIITYAPSTGTFTVGLAWATGPGNGDTFDIYKRGIRYDAIKAAVNRALRKRYYRTVVPLTEVIDGDMEANGTTSWTAATGATLSKVGTSGNLWRGLQSLRVQNDSTDDYAQSTSINVEPGTGRYVEAKYRAASGTAELVAYDVTNSKEIDSRTAETVGREQGLEWNKLWFTFTVPDDCKQIAYRLQGQEADADIYWDDVISFRAGAREMALPDYIVREGQVVRVMRQTFAGKRGDTDSFTDYFHWMLIPDQSSVMNLWRVQFEPFLSEPVWLEVSRPFGELSTDSSVCYADQEWIELAATVELLDVLKSRAPSQEVQHWRSLYKEKKDELVMLDSVMQAGPVLKWGFRSVPNTP